MDRNNFGRLHNYISVMVALRKESVDRNLGDDPEINVCYRRSPQGERG